MKKEAIEQYYCVVCRTRSNGVGITNEADGVHICLECAEMIYNVMDQWHVEHLDNCVCQYSRLAAPN